MPPKIVGPDDVAGINLPGRVMKRLAAPETMGTQNLTVGLIYVPPGATVSPCHSHNSEEVLFVVEGEGEVMIDGEVARFKAHDAILYPTNSPHMLRNTGDTEIKALFIFSPHMHPNDYRLHEEDRFPD
ncbi:MAG: cupin domain-containing protein [Chloroflexota bacterium]